MVELEMKKDSVFIVEELDTLDQMSEGYELITQLYPKMTLETYRERLVQMLPNSYGQAIVRDGRRVVGLSGYWINTRLWSGKYIDLDNVIVDEAYRSKGIGKLLMDHLVEKAKKLGCRIAVLDAYVENQGAHHFYYREGFAIRGFHFVKKI